MMAAPTVARLKFLTNTMGPPPRAGRSLYIEHIANGVAFYRSDSDCDAHSTPGHLPGCTVGRRPPGGRLPMGYLSVFVDLLAFPQKGRRAMRSLRVRPDVNTRRRACFLLALPLIALSACQTTALVPRTVAPDVSGTVTAAVQATMQAATPANSNGRSSPAITGTPSPNIAVDETFTSVPKGWPNTTDGPARYADGSYHLAPQELGRFVAINAPITTSLRDVTVAGRFHKSGGPAG